MFGAGCNNKIIFGAPGAIRTRGLWLRRPTLYPAELRAHKNFDRRQTSARFTRWDDGRLFVPHPSSLVLSLSRYLVRPAGLEPAACGFEVRRSIQLSYGRGNMSCDNKRRDDRTAVSTFSKN